MNDRGFTGPGNLSRRDFIKLGAASAGLLIGVKLGGCGQDSEARNLLLDDNGGFRPNAYLNIAADNRVTIYVAESEMGQGVWTALPMLLAEELELDWADIEVERAPVHPEFGDQYTGGSNSVRGAWLPLRRAGASARQMLINAAAGIWQVPVGECRAQSGFVIHVPTDRRSRYGELANAAARLPVPEDVELKAPDDYRVIGTDPEPLDASGKVLGTATFCSDVELDGLLVATVVHCPVFGGRLRGFDAGRAQSIKGVRHVLAITRGIAVVADNFWAVEKARRALEIEWDYGPHATTSSDTIAAQYRSAIDTSPVQVKQRGEPLAVSDPAEDGLLQAAYTLPFQAHATMEPMCCTAYVRDGECDIWAPTQASTEAQKTAAEFLLSRPEYLIRRLQQKLGSAGFDKIRIHTTFIGGGFGRRLEQDFVAEAVEISMAVNAPVKLIWSREEDMQHDFYRPYTHHRLRARVDSAGMPTHWQHQVVGPERYISAGCVAGIDYAIENFQHEFIESSCPVPTGYWRSVSCSQTNFASECFIDELATAAGKDPYHFRWGLLSSVPRLRGAMELAAEKAGWRDELPAGHFKGMAINHSHGSFVVQMVELSIDVTIRVHKVTCVIDCGQVINPDNVRAQMEGSIVFGLTACLKGAISIENGRTRQSNFHDFPLLRFDEMPLITTHIVSSREAPGGIGEPGVPPIAPAVANAVFAATGVRVRRLPITSDDIR